MPDRRVVFVVLLCGIGLLAGCKKSSESDAPNFFGSPPLVSEISVTKESKHFDCTQPVTELCCVGLPWPDCTCCCPPATGDLVLTVAADIDLVKMSATVSDPDGATNLLVVLARFFDPPGTTNTSEISLEMFDVGSNPVGTVQVGSRVYPIITGDAVQSDGVYTRYFYMKSDTVQQPADCILSTDTQAVGGTYSQYTTVSAFPATQILDFTYHVEGVDRSGNITPSPGIALPILQTEVVNASVQKPCGPSNGKGGCQPPL